MLLEHTPFHNLGILFVHLLDKIIAKIITSRLHPLLEKATLPIKLLLLLVDE